MDGWKDMRGLDRDGPEVAQWGGEASERMRNLLASGYSHRDATRSIEEWLFGRPDVPDYLVFDIMAQVPSMTIIYTRPTKSLVIYALQAGNTIEESSAEIIEES